VVVDGNDVEAVLDSTTLAVSRARAGEGSTLIEAITYRFCGHMVGDAQTYRSKEEVESWRRKDPLLVARQKLAERDVKESIVAQVIRDVETEVEDAIAFAKQSPEPDKEDVLNYVYA
jgi:TPP-dependent pyruvate/acetoin dehydrogenase alpha subunit